MKRDVIRRKLNSKTKTEKVSTVVGHGSLTLLLAINLYKVAILRGPQNDTLTLALLCTYSTEPIICRDETTDANHTRLETGDLMRYKRVYIPGAAVFSKDKLTANENWE